MRNLGIVSHYTLRRVEHLRRTVIETLGKMKGRRADDGKGQRSENRGQMSEDRCQKTDVRRQRTKG